MKIVSIESSKLHHASETDALKAFDDFIGDENQWASKLVQHRIKSDWEKDWRIEVGQWVLRARALGFEDWIQKRLKGARQAIKKPEEVNDNAHASLSAELAPAMLAHYLLGTGWNFGRWEPTPSDPTVDIDETLLAPTGEEVAFQVKACDKPGQWREDRLVQPGDGKIIKRQYIVEGEVDEWVRAATRSAAKQLPRPAKQPQIIALCSQRTWALGGNPGVVESMLLGSTLNIDGVSRLDYGLIDRELATNPASTLKRGEFRDSWNHIGAVITVDYRRGADRFDYMCTVIVNPWAETAARCRGEWFPHARVLELRGAHFEWSPSAPGDTTFGGNPILVAPPAGS